MKRNVAVLESIRELDDLFFETGDISRNEYEQTKRMFPLPEERTGSVKSDDDFVTRPIVKRTAARLTTARN